MTRKGIFFIAGEASGDCHAAGLIAALRRLDPSLPVAGAGGEKMQAAGMDQVIDLTVHAVVGLVEVLKNYGTFKKIFDDLLGAVAERKPAAVVLVDFPGFNLRFARAVRRRFPSCRVIYYISPQLWAWHASRARQIERNVDLMLTIFPFEKDWYARHAPSLHAEFVGHPFLDQSPLPGADAADRDPNLVLLLPGSREREVAKIFPVMAGAVDRLARADRAGLRFVAVAATESLVPLMQHPAVEVRVGGAAELMQRARLAITASGTATMECALHGCPMIVVYRVNWLTYWVGRAVVTVDWLAMPNVIAGREIVPEFIQHNATPSAVAEAVGELLGDAERYGRMQRDLREVVASLGGPGAAERAAKLVQAELAGTPSRQ